MRRRVRVLYKHTHLLAAARTRRRRVNLKAGEKHVDQPLQLNQGLASMRLYIMRHGPAEDDSPTGRDANRALTKSGRARVHAVAQSLVDHDEAPLAILSSPLVRAFQTAQVVAAVIEFAARARAGKNSRFSVAMSATSATSSVEMRPELRPGLDAMGFVSSLVRAERKRVMIVGHEPDLGMLVARLVGESHIEGGLLKAMVVGIKLTPTTKASGMGFTSKLRFVLHPKTLAWHRL